MSCFVLIPGAGGDSWYWHRVVPLLVEAGHEVVVVDLPGDDESFGLPEYVGLTTEAIGDRDDVVLVAQSLGGFTATMVADRIDVGAVVFVNAMVPTPGETAGDWWENTGAPRARIEAAEREGYGTDFDPAVYFLHDVAADVLATAEGEPRAEAGAVFGSVCDFEAWPSVPIRAASGADDRFFPLEFQRSLVRDRLGLEVDVLPGGHLIALAQPNALATYLIGVNSDR